MRCHFRDLVLKKTAASVLGELFPLNLSLWRNPAVLVRNRGFGMNLEVDLPVRSSDENADLADSLTGIS